MAVYYSDSSSLAKVYISETGTTWITALFTAPGSVVYTARVTGAEVLSAIERRQRRGALASADAQIAIGEFRADYMQNLHLIEVTLTIVDEAMDLVEKHGLRGYDAVQLACALEVNASLLIQKLPPVTLVSADAELNAAAIAEGLTVEDPNAHP